MGQQRDATGRFSKDQVPPPPPPPAPRLSKPVLGGFNLHEVITLLTVAVAFLTALTNALGTFDSTPPSKASIQATVAPKEADIKKASILASTQPVKTCDVPTGAGTLGACAPKAAYASVATGTALLRSASHDPVHGLIGPDVSSYQSDVNWSVVRRHASFAFVKAGEGQSWTDPTFARNWRELRAQRLPHGAYYFVRPSPTPNSARFQADRFVNIVNAQGGFDSLPPVIDAEASVGLGPSALYDWVKGFESRVRARVGRAPIIYTGTWWWAPNIGARLNLGTALWISAYAGSPVLPVSWRSWLFWQFSDGQYGPLPHSIPGINSPGNASDISVFNGSRATLARLANARLAQPPSKHAQTLCREYAHYKREVKAHTFPAAKRARAVAVRNALASRHYGCSLAGVAYRK